MDWLGGGDALREWQAVRLAVTGEPRLISDADSEGSVCPRCLPPPID